MSATRFPDGMQFRESSYFFLLCLILGHLITIIHMVCENGQDRFEYFEIFKNLNIYILHICMILKIDNVTKQTKGDLL